MEFADKLPEYTFEELFNLLKTNIKKQLFYPYMPSQILFIISPPGRGKTTQMKKFAEKEGFIFLSYNVGNVDPAFFQGVPYPEKGEKGLTTKWSFSPFYEEVEKVSQKGNVLLFIDDLHLADRSIQGVLMELLTSKSVEGRKIPDNVVIVSAGNFSELSGAENLYSAIMNRVKPVKLTTDPHKVYVEFINFIKEEGIEDKLSQAGLFFISINKEVLVEKETVGPFGSLRSITDFLLELKMLEDSGVPLHVRENLAFSAMSYDSAVNFRRYYSLINKFLNKELTTEISEKENAELFKSFLTFKVLKQYEEFFYYLLKGQKEKAFIELKKLFEEIDRIIEQAKTEFNTSIYRTVLVSTILPKAKELLSKLSELSTSDSNVKEFLTYLKERKRELNIPEDVESVLTYLVRKHILEVKIPLVFNNTTRNIKIVDYITEEVGNKIDGINI